ncbi:hypothetical protein AAG570_011133 [Ranatra chinensis]|uniref:Malonyl-CoA:ACP transacylase (MAT) domain-containing protein n=1 Tax=Ranatra chinensis TaxID=642074 RepID=A0ABD0YJQ8_9HEMI
MVTVLCRADTNIAEACRKAREHCASVAPRSQSGQETSPYCAVSNYLFPQGRIIAGHVEAIKYLEDNSIELGLKKVRRLPVSGAFHTPLMEPAVEVFREALKRAKLGEPQIAVHSNVNGKRYRDSRHVIKQLPNQIVAPVKWEQTMHIMYERSKEDEPKFPNTYECGPGNSLATMLKMVNAKAWQSCKSVMVQFTLQSTCPLYSV